MSHLVGTVVLPGDVLEFPKQGADFEGDKNKITLGPGIERISHEITVTKCGILRQKHPNIYWIDCHQKRYVPTKGDHVLGVVTAKFGDLFRVDVGADDTASLSYLAFEGATKRNRPDVKVGDLVYAEFIMANKYMEYELACVNLNGKSCGMGVIRRGGFMFRCSLNLVRKILAKDSVLMKCLGDVAMETAVGLNGRVWINAKSSKETIAISNAISAAEFMSNEQIRVMCKKLSSVLAGFD